MRHHSLIFYNLQQVIKVVSSTYMFNNYKCTWLTTDVSVITLSIYAVCWFLAESKAT